MTNKQIVEDVFSYVKVRNLDESEHVQSLKTELLRLLAAARQEGEPQASLELHKLLDKVIQWGCSCDLLNNYGCGHEAIVTAIAEFFRPSAPSGSAGPEAKIEICGWPMGFSGYLEVYCDKPKGHDNGKHEPEGRAEPAADWHKPGCPRYSGVGECDCDTNAVVSASPEPKCELCAAKVPHEWQFCRPAAQPVAADMTQQYDALLTEAVKHKGHPPNIGRLAEDCYKAGEAEYGVRGAADLTKVEEVAARKICSELYLCFAKRRLIVSPLLEKSSRELVGNILRPFITQISQPVLHRSCLNHNEYSAACDACWRETFMAPMTPVSGNGPERER